MAYKINGVVRLDNSGNANLGVATATEFDGKVSKKAITEQTEGDDTNITGADEILLYDKATDDLLRVTVDEFALGSGIGTIVTDFNSLNVSGVVTAGIVTAEYHYGGFIGTVYNNTGNPILRSEDASFAGTVYGDIIVGTSGFSTFKDVMMTGVTTASYIDATAGLGIVTAQYHYGGFIGTVYNNTGNPILRSEDASFAGTVYGDIIVGTSGFSTFKDVVISGVTTMNDSLTVDDSNNLGTEYNFNVKTSGSSVFGVLGNGAVLLGNSAASPFIATNDHHATSKKYVDDAISASSPSLPSTINIPDDGEITFGDSNDFKIYHDGDHTYLDESGQGNLKVRTNTLKVSNVAETKDSLLAQVNGSVELYHDGSKKLETTSTGVTVTGVVTATDLNVTGLDIDLDSDSGNNSLTLRLGTMGTDRPLLWTDVTTWNVINTASTSHPRSVYLGGRVYGEANVATKGSTFNNVFIGYESGYSLSGSVDNNVFIGYRSGKGDPGSGYSASPIIRSSDNTAVGSGAGGDINNVTNGTFIGHDAGTSRSPSGAVRTTNNIIVLGDDSVTQLFCADTSISSSDGRDKTDVEDFTAGLSFIEALRPVTYRWDKRSWYVEHEEESLLDVDPDGSKKQEKLHIGFIAQEMEEVEKAHGYANSRDDQLIVNLTEDETRYGVKYERLVPVLVNAIKELKAEIEELKKAQ